MVLLNKRGQTFADLLIVIIFLFVIGVSSIFGYLIYNSLNDEMQADSDMSLQAKAAADTVNTGYPQYMDKAVLLVAILLWAALLISSYLIDTSPIFFVVTLIVLLIVFAAGMIISNIFQDIMGESEIAGFASSFPITNFIMGNLLMVMIVFGLTSALALYAKNRL